jgi:RNA polymerase sigma-70 factor (ECF subfamily)
MPDDIRLRTWFDSVALEEYEHVQRLCRYLVNGAGFDISLAADLTQQVFFTAWMKREELQNHPQVRAWLYKTVRYTFNNFLRKQLYMQKMQAMSLDDIHIAECFHPQSEDVLEALLAGEPSDVMLRILDKLSNKDQRLYRHLYLIQRDIPSLCQDLGVSEKTLKKRIYRLHQRLIHFMEEEKFQPVSK